MHGYKRRRRTIILSIAIGIMLICLFGLTLHLIETHGLQENQFGDSGDWADDEDAEYQYLTLGDKNYISYDKIDTFIIAGTDGGGEDKGEGFNGDLADFIMLLLIDHSTKSYAFYQVDRNTIVDVPVMNAQGDFDDYFPQQICLAHWYGYDDDTRNENLVNAAFDVFGGLDLDKYYVMGMEDIDTINDAIGGVTVTIDSDMTKLDPAFTEGATVHLNGAQAEKYLRARRGLDDATNAARMKRQRQYMDNAYTMIISQLRENPEYINDLYESLKDVFQTNGEGKDISRITNCIVNYDNKGTITFDGRTEVNDTIGEGIEHEEFYLDYNSVLKGLRQVMNLEEDA